MRLQSGSANPWDGALIRCVLLYRRCSHRLPTVCFPATAVAAVSESPLATSPDRIDRLEPAAKPLARVFPGKTDFGQRRNTAHSRNSPDINTEDAKGAEKINTSASGFAGLAWHRHAESFENLRGRRHNCRANSANSDDAPQCFGRRFEPTLTSSADIVAPPQVIEKHAIAARTSLSLGVNFL